MLRTVKEVHEAVYEPIGDLVTYRAMPTERVPMNRLDPFLFLNHHGYQEYRPQNNGLPFGPHPHRGFETVTFILEGDLTHKDSSGAQSVIKAGGVQWMTAGSGLIHAEVSSEEFKQNGGPLEILQLWVNLPACHKMTAPKYTGLQKEDIPALLFDNGKVTAHLVSGRWNGTEAPVQPLTDMHLSYINFKEGGSISFAVPAGKTVFLYTTKGEINVNGRYARMHHLVEFGDEGDEITMTARTESLILFGYATPLREPLAAYGPFVMNTREEIAQAYDDYRNGKMGKIAEAVR